jgi:hypothetical protein
MTALLEIQLPRATAARRSEKRGASAWRSFLDFAPMRARSPGLTLRAALAAVLLVAACGGRDGGSGTGSWQFKVDTTRSETDGSVRETSWLRVIGKERPEGAAETKAVILSFDCFRDHAISTIMTDQALRQGSAEARLTVDADSPRRIPGFAGTTSSGGQLVLTIPQDSMLALLNRHQRAVIEYVDGAGSSKTIAEFSIAGLEKYRGPFLAVCAKAGAR